MNKTDYERGWDDSIAYQRDYRRAHSGTAGGVGLMVVGFMGAVTMSIMAILIGLAHLNIFNMLISSLVFATLVVVGYFIDRAETRSYKKRQKEFHDKWAPIFEKEIGDK